MFSHSHLHPTHSPTTLTFTSTYPPTPHPTPTHSHLSDIAKIYETAGDKANAEVFYRQAADLFKGEEQKSDYNRCMLSVAQFSAEGERYLDAAQIYEDVARQVRWVGRWVR